MRRLVLHIGNPKAGSSSLQNFLFNNREALAAKGILFPFIPGEGRQSHANLPKSISGRRLGPRQGKLTFAALRDIVGRSSAHTIIVSSEFFVSGRRFPEIIARVEDFAAAADLSLTIVACIRPPHLWINSSFAQATKTFKNARPFRAFVERRLGQERFDPLRALEPWMEIPRSRFVALPFAPEHLTPNFEAAFFRCASIGNVTEEFLSALPRAVANRSPGPMTVEACRQIVARAARTPDFDARKKYFRKSVSRAALEFGWDDQSFMGLTDELKAAIWKRFAPSNNDFARRVWGSDWDDVFAAERSRIFVPNEIRREVCPDEEWKILQSVVDAALETGD